MNITVVGTGYVGLVTGTCLAEMGHRVACQDIDREKVVGLRRGEMPIYEPGLEELVKRNSEAGRLRFETDLGEALTGARVAFIAVGTPPDEDGSADVRHVLKVAEDLAHATADGSALMVVVKSTVPVGTCERVRLRLKDVLGSLDKSVDFEVASNPEFLKEGAAVRDFMRPDRIVIGTDSEHGRDLLHQIYRSFVRSGHPLVQMDTRSSEMTKYAANVMLATRISLMNEIALLCDEVDADVENVRKGIGLDTRIGKQFLYAGIGYGGSCFPKDVRALSGLAVNADCPADILDAVEKVNRHQKALLANRVLRHFGTVRGRRLALWGLAFKPETDDIREAPALVIARRLLDEGAHVTAYDPEAVDNARRYFADRGNIDFAADAYAALERADALIIATEWGQFRNPDFEAIKARMAQPVVFDGRNLFEPAEMKQLGFEYHCIGRGAV